MGYIVAELKDVPENLDFFITFTGAPHFDDIFSKIATGLEKDSAIINLYGSDSRLIKDEMNEKSQNLISYLKKSAGGQGHSDVLYITSKRADKFSDEDYGIALVKQWDDKHFNDKCLKLPELLEATKLRYPEGGFSTNELLWLELYGQIKQIFGDCVLPIGNYAGYISKIA